MANQGALGITPRRSSYASVVSGSANRAGALSGLSLPSSFQPPRHYTRHSSDFEAYSSLPTGGGFGMLSHGSSKGSQFFTPSYLRRSKYVERLSEGHKAKLTTQRDISTGGGSLSTSSSSANLQKMAQVHHGVNISVTERELPSSEDGLTPLPSRWNDSDKANGISVQSEGLEACFMSASKAHAINEHDALTVRADHFMPPQCGIYYFEVTINAKSKDNSSMIGIGFCGPNVPLNRLPGWLQDSWAYHGDDGNAFCCNPLGKAYAEKFTTGDVVGCGLNFRTGSAFFTKNGLFLNTAFTQLKNKGPLYPTVGMKRLGESVKANFGQKPFVFDIDDMMRREKLFLEKEINGSVADSLSPTLSETALVQALVAQYLAHDGYVETARAFAGEVANEARDLHIDGFADFKPYEAEEDLDAVNRQRIRGAIIEGDVDKALKHTHAYYPNVLRDNPQIYFRLRCRKFIEMMKQCSDLLSMTHQDSADDVNGVFEQDMEIDDQLGEAVANKYQDLLQDTLQYGQVLQSEFKDDGRKEVKKALEETFHLMAYEDPKKSIVAHLLEPSGRIPVAEELNSAILVSLGKSSTACLERLCQQTEALVDSLAEDGGPGALINVKEDYLK